MKLILIFKKLLLCFFLLILISCSNDEDTVFVEPPTFDVSKLQRGWSYDRVVVDYQIYLYQHNEMCHRDLFGFRNREGQEYQFEENIWEYDHCANFQAFMEWKPIGDYVELYFGEYYVGRFLVIELTSEYFHFVLEVDINNDGTVEEQEMIAIPYDPFDSF